MNFNKIIGHENIKDQINKAINSGMFSHAHLVVGENGIGKSVLTRAMAIKLLGREEDKEYADLIEYRVAKNKQSIGIKEVTEKIIEEINKKPYEGDRKVIIIYQADKMTVDAQNAFLKTIEEPPKGVFIILLCENLELILETIKSRCQIHKLQRLSIEEMNLYLNKKYPNLKPAELKTIVAFSDGIPGRAESFIEDEDFKQIRNTTLDILLNIKEKKIVDFLKYGDFLMKYKNDWREVLTWFLSYIRDTMIYKETGREDLVINVDKVNMIKDLTAMFSFNKLSDIIDIINETRRRLDRNVNTSLVFENMLVKFQED